MLEIKNIDRLKKRDSSLDLIRIIAFFSVISVHFFSYIEFYGQTVVGKRMYLMVLLRSFFMDCVPLFMILSGFLMNRKKISSSYFIGILKTLFVYLLASLFCLLYSLRTTPLSIKDVIAKLLDFTGAPYAWYIEMYLGLFLLIPFLNLIYHGLDNKQQKQLLVIIFLILTAVPAILNTRWKLFPSWWTYLYPVSYYFIGTYISEYPPKIKNRYLLILLILHIVCMGSFNYYKSYNNTFVRGIWNDWGSLMNVITSVLVFLLIKNIKTQDWSLKFKQFIQYISGLCLGAYLLSWIFDTMYYPVLLSKVPEATHRIEYMGIMVPLIAISALALSAIATFIGNNMSRIIEKQIL